MPLKKAQTLLAQTKGHPLNLEQRKKKAIELASYLLEEAIATQTAEEKHTQEELARMMSDPNGKAFTMSMTDQCFRSQATGRIANQLIFLLKQFGIPSYLSPFKRFSLWIFRWLGAIFHPIMVPVAKKTLRKATDRVILPGEKHALSKHMHRRRREGVRLNLNHLGEAILGEKEAVHRLNIYLRDLERDDIEYVSIKISTIYSQINLLDWDKTIEILAERLRQLYRAAMHHTFKRADGKRMPKFVNLDMEEYKDLHLTKELFKKVLMEPEFMGFSAGIVLQAYLPDSYHIQQELTEWAKERCNKGGAPVKIRIVKGANLAMEQFDASLHDWEQTPYKSKHEVDANYKRMVSYGCKKENAQAVHLGIASHNLFDIAFAMLLRVENEIEEEISFEMLEGMADHIRRVVQKLTGSILLYCPVATREDFQSAIAYLIRRLDENTGPENFLRHSFGLRPGTSDWLSQVELFERACDEIQSVSAEPRRKQNRFQPPKPHPMDSYFENEADTDLALPQNHQWAHQIINEWKNKTFETIPLVIGGQTITQNPPKGSGVDPSRPDHELYRYSLATWEEVDRALECAKNYEKNWASRSVRERSELMSNAAQVMRARRSELLGVMMCDGGKSFVESEPEVSEAIDFAEYYLRSMMQMEAMREIQFSPKGTILVAPPWNFPISIPAGGIIAALITGNCVLFKPAPEAVLSGWILVNLFWAAGIPREALQFFSCADDPIGSQLIQDPRLDAVILTGGTATARLFMRMRPTLDLAAETGGKNAMIITALSDRDLAIKCLVQSAFGHSGQKCSAASLAILEAEVYDDPNFMRQLKDAVESLHVSNSWDLSCRVNPLINPPSGSLLKGLTSLDPGEAWLVEPRPNPDNPRLWSPGVKIGVKEGSFMHQTELFGPVLGVMRAKNLEDAIRLANGTPYGLTSGLQSLDEREIRLWSSKIEAGNCYINRGITGAIVQRQPFGGCKASSFGHGSKAGGPNYIAQFMHKKQRGMPAEKHPVHESVTALTAELEKIHLTPEEQGIWFASIANYAYWAKRFSRDDDPSKVVGEDNFFCYRPHKNMVLRIQKGDRPLDIYRVRAAALCCKTNLEISSDPQENSLIDRIKRGEIQRIRLLSPPSDALREAAAQSGCYLNQEPVLASGRLELLNYLREMALSCDYHRYGNLGLREGEVRAEIL